MVKLLKEANLLGNNVPWIKEFRQKGETVFEKSGFKSGVNSFIHPAQPSAVPGKIRII